MYRNSHVADHILPVYCLLFRSFLIWLLKLCLHRKHLLQGQSCCVFLKISLMWVPRMGIVLRLQNLSMDLLWKVSVLSRGKTRKFTSLLWIYECCLLVCHFRWGLEFFSLWLVRLWVHWIDVRILLINNNTLTSIICRESRIWLSLGGFQEKGSDDSHLRNTHVLIDDAGNIRSTYSKMFL